MTGANCGFFIRFIFQQPLLLSRVFFNNESNPSTHMKKKDEYNNAPSYEELVLELARQVKFNEADEEKLESSFPDAGDS